MINMTSTGTSNRTRNWYLCRRGCIIGVDVLITLFSNTVPLGVLSLLVMPAGSHGSSQIRICCPSPTLQIKPFSKALIPLSILRHVYDMPCCSCTCSKSPFGQYRTLNTYLPGLFVLCLVVWIFFFIFFLLAYLFFSLFNFLNWSSGYGIIWFQWTRIRFRKID